jgi:hypothetical protein
MYFLVVKYNKRVKFKEVLSHFLNNKKKGLKNKHLGFLTFLY